MSRLAASITALASPTAHSVEARALAASVVNDEPIGDQSDRIQSRASLRAAEALLSASEVLTKMSVRVGRSAIRSPPGVGEQEVSDDLAARFVQAGRDVAETVCAERS